MISGGDDRYKNAVTEVLIPDKVSECSLVRDGSRSGTCLSDKAIDYLSKKANIDVTRLSDDEAMKLIHDRYGTRNDRGLMMQLPDDLADVEQINLKIPGPKGTELLSNTDIDGIMKQWEMAFDGFFAYNFNMLDYTDFSFRNGRVQEGADTLASIDPVELFGRYKCAACIINSDFYRGHGKHWMAIFVDNRGSHPTAEFFNSSGRAPVPEWLSYLERAQRAVDIVNASATPKKEKCLLVHNQLVQQHSMTECGLYSLFYVWSRLNNMPYGYFDKEQVFDQLMIEFRAHLFDGYTTNPDGKWSFDDFKKSNHVKWDHPDGHREGDV